MTIKVGDKFPDATLLRMGENGPESVQLSAFTTGKKVVIFGLPGAFTGGCTKTHLPSFIRTKPGFDAKGVDAVICIAANDPFALKAWSDMTGATEAGIHILGDSESKLTEELGLMFSAPAIGLIRRCTRFASVVEDGVVTILNLEEKAGVCELTVGENLLAKM